MTSSSSTTSATRPLTRQPLFWVALVALLTAAGVWLALTPAGLLGKADAVGYAVCHRITVRSFLYPDGRQLPLCARCSGTFLGVLIGLFGPGLIAGRRRAAGFAPTALLAVMLGASALWAFDGANSFAHLIDAPWVPRLYEPSNFLRLVTGTFHGITMGAFILPILNDTLWADARNEPVIRGWGGLALLYAAGAALIVLVLWGPPVLRYPLGVLSAVGVLVILGAIFTVLIATLLRRDRSAYTLVQALPVLMLGLAAALVMVGGIDAGRYAMFGTWDGFTIPGA